MDSSPPSSPSIRARALLIALVAFISYAYFYGGGGWNQNSRFDLIRAILDHRTLRIDSYQENTEDKAVYQGHYYSDKAPGVVFLALPAAAATRSVLRVLGMDPASPRGLVAISYMATLCSVAAPAALACSCLFLIALRLGGRVDAAAFAALSMGLGTPMWAYATLLWGHALAGACLVFGFGSALMLGKRENDRRDLLWGLATGLTAGWATVTEYPAAPASAILAILALARVWPNGWRSRRRTAIGIAAGAMVCIAVLMTYQYAAFHSIFRPSYAYYETGSFPLMKRGYLGLRYPRLDVMLKLLFGCFRGLFVVSPIAAAAPFGLRLLWKQSGSRGAAAAVAGIAAYYWLFHGSFISWHAGWSWGPRYMAAGVPLLCLGLAPAWTSSRSSWRRVLTILALAAVLFSLMAVATTPQPPFEYTCPLVQLTWPSFWRGQLSLEKTSVLLPSEDPDHTHGAFNLGELAGLHGLPSLLPLILVWALAAIGWVRLNSRDNSPSAPIASPSRE